MFWMNPPECPCDPAAKKWIEGRLEWLSARFPSNIFTDRPLVLPTHEFFPLEYEPSKECARALFARICGFMGVSEDRVTLKFFHAPTQRTRFVDAAGQDAPGPGFAGMYTHSYRSHMITLDTDQLYHPEHLIPTMAHELAHGRLLGKVGRINNDEELLTDLTACVLGFAVFQANSPRTWVSQFTKWPGTDFNKPAYMTSPMFGYVLAHLAWFQGERKPDWAKYLGSNVINDFKDATGYLFKTEGSTFRPTGRKHSRGRRV
jgi:hypothetical protein